MPPWDPLTSVERRSRPRVPLRAPEGSGPRLVQEETHWFRRTRILRSREEVVAACAQVIDELGEMTGPQLRVYPNPSPKPGR
jgi:hypothetical protein